MKKNNASQRGLATELGVNLVEMNLVIAGRAFLDEPRFAKACQILNVRATELYPAETLLLMYGTDEKAPAKRRVAQVRLDDDVRELVDFVARDEHLNRAQAANAIIRRAFETRRIEA
ncbi:MAG: hypothetical protein IJI71_03150 [Clostridia bacterium]|nr:hypothetical protein [Clostridia bacterium]